MIPARYEVHLKIDNLNVEDILEADKMDGLKRIFQKQLWSNSARDLYVTFLGSAVELGARKPLNPIQKEGVVVRLGSYEPFTTELQKLHEEVGPLRKILATMNECPRDFKRTSVEVLFRNASFTLDWCNFRLIDNDDSDMHHSGANEKLLSTDEEILNHDHWQPVSRMEIPQRTYGHELLVSILVPTFIMIILASVLSFVLCFHHDDIDDEDEEFLKICFIFVPDYYYDHYIYRSKNIDSIPRRSKPICNYPKSYQHH
ncbi:hypothetical protein NQ317_003024 [Molorchus minor]|uniref:Sarcoglycan alpha/epsilon second domain-containing protein n=1 Tax=Molorchus minor TaxID=1323400 RepID=A0ABQ9IUZ5_9CUCU|nr:hypothetical protein NQ317_003024 [Molorchus minor]